MPITYNPPGNLSYPGSSGYGVTGGRYGLKSMPPPGSVQNDPSDYPVYDPATGKLVSVKTSKSWTGTAPDGQSYKEGVLVPYSDQTINPNDPNQRYKPVDIVKSPDIAAGEKNLMETFNKAAQSSLSDFGSVLNQFKTDTAAARTKLNQATDIGPTIATLQGAQDRYGRSLDTAVSDYAAQNTRQAATERGIVADANRLLPQYDTAAQNIGDRQVQELAKQLSRYKLSGGTPSSMGTDEAQILARGVADVQLPLEQAKIGRQMDLLTNLSLPVERELGAAEVNRIAQFNPAIAGQQFTSTQGTANAIQSLKTQVAGMSIDAAIKFMQAQGVPGQIINQVLAGQISNLGALGQIEDQSRYRGLQDVLGANLSQPTGYNTASPAYPTVNTRYPTTTRTGSTGSTADITPIARMPVRSSDYKAPIVGPLQPDNYGVDAPARGGGGGYIVNPDGTVSYLGADTSKNYDAAYGGQYAGWTPEDFTQGDYY